MSFIYFTQRKYSSTAPKFQNYQSQWYYSFSNIHSILINPASYDEDTAIIFEMNNIMFELNCNVFIDICGVHHQYIKLSWHKLIKVKYSLFFLSEVGHLAEISTGSRTWTKREEWASHSSRNNVILSCPTCLFNFFYLFFFKYIFLPRHK